MSGHNKWAQIKRQKAVTDAAKSRVFSRFARLITLESKKAGGNADAPSLAAVVARAKAANMPKDNIERAIAKGLSKDAGELLQVTYEAYGPGGCALIVDALTDNKKSHHTGNKASIFKNGIELASPGAASWAFEKRADGSLAPNEPLVTLGESDAEALEILLALDEHDDVQKVYVNADGYGDTEDA